MILLMDVGNTNIKLGLDNGAKTLKTWRIATDRNKTADEFGMVLFDLLRQNGYQFSDVNGIIVSSVAPSMNYTLEHMCTYYMKIKPIMVSSAINLNVKLDYNSPQDLGADRIVNAAAAFHHYGGPIITIDFGSATTFGVVSGDGTFLGGLIAPGIKSSTEALVNTTAKLPRIELVKPRSVVGKTTISNMQSGVIYGFVGLVKNIISEIKRETGFEKAKVVATGGMSQIIMQSGDIPIDLVDRALSLKGLKVLYDLNSDIKK